jgi:hypothetical protein
VSRALAASVLVSSAIARRKERWNGLTVEAWFQRTARPSSAAGGVP